MGDLKEYLVIIRTVEEYQSVIDYLFRIGVDWSSHANPFNPHLEYFHNRGDDRYFCFDAFVSDSDSKESYILQTSIPKNSSLKFIKRVGAMDYNQFTSEVGIPNIYLSSDDESVIRVSREVYDALNEMRNSDNPLISIYNEDTSLTIYEVFEEVPELEERNKELLGWLSGQDDISILIKSGLITKFILESKEGDAYFKWNQNKRPIWTDNVNKAYKFTTYESAEKFLTPDWHIVSKGFMPEDLTD